MLRTLAFVVSILASVFPAIACATSGMAYFDFGGNSYPGSYKGDEQVKYFIGRVLRLTRNENSEATPTALLQVLKEYSFVWGNSTTPRLPDMVTMQIQSPGCLGWGIQEQDVGVFAYYEAEGTLWLAWQPGQF